MNDEPTYMSDYRRSQNIATPAERRDNEILDAHVDTYARQLIVEQIELTLGQTDWKSHDLIDQVTWNRVRDRAFYILGEMAPEESQYQVASVYLEEME